MKCDTRSFQLERRKILGLPQEELEQQQRNKTITRNYIKHEHKIKENCKKGGKLPYTLHGELKFKGKTMKNLHPPRHSGK
jgi:hypothetical protein